MGHSLYAGLKTYKQLEAPTRRLSLIPCRPHYNFGYGTADRLPYP